jgi:hypothetical protein
MIRTLGIAVCCKRNTVPGRAHLYFIKAQRWPRPEPNKKKGDRTRAHRHWIDTLAWTYEQAVVEDYLLAMDHTEARLQDLDVRLAEIAEIEPYREPVG